MKLLKVFDIKKHIHKYVTLAKILSKTEPHVENISQQMWFFFLRLMTLLLYQLAKRVDYVINQ